MGYRDDFYQVWNIVGYTGDLHNFPTVYFVSPDLDLGGHITQKHALASNVGRQEVFSLQGYTYGNETYQGKYRLVERWADGGIHPSRNPIVKIDQDKPDMKTVSILAKAIRDYPEEKYISDILEGDRDLIIGAFNAKHAAMGVMKDITNRGNMAREKRGL